MFMDLLYEDDILLFNRTIWNITYFTENATLNESFPHLPFNWTLYKNEGVVDLVQNITITCIAIVIIAATVFGNILVVIAVCTERRLRKVGNSFIVSLAVSDLLVGVVVTPLAVAYQLSGDWLLGTIMCDFWISMDVICCTASIVNLCVISIDRYNAITQPLKYALKRTPQRAAVMIALAWMFSFLIAFPPLFGWREKRPDPITVCEISQDKAYTIFSTMGAFYVPLVLMLIVYGKIFQAALQRRKQWIPGPGSSHVNLHCGSKILHSGGSLPKNVKQKKNLKPDKSSVADKAFQEINPRIGYRLMLQGDLSLTASTESLCISLIQSNSGLGFDRKAQSAPSSKVSSPLDPITVGILKTRNLSESNSHFDTSDHEISYNHHNQNATSTFVKNNRYSINFSLVKEDSVLEETQLYKYRSQSVTSISHYALDTMIRKPVVIKNDKPRISVTQERRAAKTLGIIMGCFILCWLPFFLIALIRPFCQSCTFHPILNSIFLWLGYFNSALNPIIYTFFNQDFRRAFARLLYCPEKDKS